jgi:hypothetical protein
VKAGVLATVMIAAGVAPAAQQVPPPADAQARTQHVRVMEGVLMQAVRHGAEQLGRRMQAIDPNLVLLTGSARARGFVLDGYGVFFDVEIPGVQQSVAWSVRTLQRDRDLDSAFRSLQTAVQSLQDERTRTQLEKDLRRIQLLAPLAPQMQAQPPGGGVAAATVDTTAPADPSEEYTTAVKESLINAMLDYSRPMSLQADEWLTIAARDSEGPVVPGQLYEATTIVLRVKGADLVAFHSGQITRDEARKRVDVREF